MSGMASTRTSLPGLRRVWHVNGQRFIATFLRRYNSSPHQIIVLITYIVGPLPSSQGTSYLFTIVDHFTRWPEAIPMADATAVSCARALLENWVPRFGVPTDIVSDRGRQFISGLWMELGETTGHATSSHDSLPCTIEWLS